MELVVQARCDPLGTYWAPALSQLHGGSWGHRVEDDRVCVPEKSVQSGKQKSEVQQILQSLQCGKYCNVVSPGGHGTWERHFTWSSEVEEASRQGGPPGDWEGGRALAIEGETGERPGLFWELPAFLSLSLGEVVE